MFKKNVALMQADMGVSDGHTCIADATTNACKQRRNQLCLSDGPSAQSRW